MPCVCRASQIAAMPAHPSLVSTALRHFSARLRNQAGAPLNLGTALTAQRTFTNTSATRAAVDIKQQAERRARQALKAKTKQSQAKKLVKLKEDAQNPTKDPLYMEIPEALRFLRAAEVGRPPKDSTIVLSIRIIAGRGVAPVSGSVKYPHPVKSTRFCVVTNDEGKQAESLAAGAAVAGGDELLEEIKVGKIPLNFDVLYASPDMLKALAPLARVLGPKGLMPSVKKGTVTEDFVGKIQESSGSVVFKQRGNLLAVPIGRTDFSDRQVVENLTILVNSVSDSMKRIISKEPILIGRTHLKSAHGPNIRIRVR